MAGFTMSVGPGFATSQISLFACCAIPPDTFGAVGAVTHPTSIKTSKSLPRRKAKPVFTAVNGSNLFRMLAN